MRDKITRCQYEAVKVLWEAFQGGRLTAASVFDKILQQDAPEATAYRMIEGMLQLARDRLLRRAELENHGRHLKAIEATLGDPDRDIAPGQASQISKAVKAVATKLSEASGKNECCGVYSQLYRRFGWTFYESFPVGKFQEAMDWLTEWRGQATEGESFQ